MLKKRKRVEGDQKFVFPLGKHRKIEFCLSPNVQRDFLVLSHKPYINGENLTVLNTLRFKIEGNQIVGPNKDFNVKLLKEYTSNDRTFFDSGSITKMNKTTIQMQQRKRLLMVPKVEAFLQGLLPKMGRQEYVWVDVDENTKKRIMTDHESSVYKAFMRHELSERHILRLILDLIYE
jgi:hypothetical protein